MAKKKKTNGRKTFRKAAVEAKPNLFERLSNKKRFDVLGKKTKGEVRELGRLRTAANEKRKSTLLVEYRQLRKSNDFIDRRFGEDDEDLAPDDRALLRYQKQRIKDVAGSRFALPDPDDEYDGGSAFGERLTLTHLGRSLTENAGGFGWRSDGDDEDDMDADGALTAAAHFGGGFVPSLRNDSQERAAGLWNVDQGGVREREGHDGDARHRSKKEIMEEVIAKSKAARALKSQQRGEDLDATEELDKKWKALASASALTGLVARAPARARTTTTTKGGDAATEQGDPSDAFVVLPQAEEDKRFDALTRELVFEAKAKPGERTLTADELAELERQRLEELEKRRLKRQREETAGMEDEHHEYDGARGGGDDLEDDFGGGAAAGAGNEEMPAGGYAARRAKRAKVQAEAEAWRREKRRNGGDEETEGEEDENEDEDGSSGDDDDSLDGATAVERRRQRQAAGDHPLQASFREAAAKLLKRHGVSGKDKKKGLDDDESDDGLSDGDTSSGDGDEAENEEGTSEGSDESDEDGSQSEGQAGDSDSDSESGASESDRDRGASPGVEGEGHEKHTKGTRHHHLGDEDDKNKGSVGTPAGGDGGAVVAAAAAGDGAQKQKNQQPAIVDASDTLTFTPSLPDSYESFARQASGLSPENVDELLRRMRAFNAAALSTDARKRMQLLYGCVLQHFVTLAASQSTFSMPHLDALVPHILEMTPQVPFYAATLARARLQRAYSAMAAKLKDPLLRSAAWPAPKTLLLLKLCTILYPVTDKRHPVVTPASVLCCSALALCPLARPRDVATGLFLASLAVHMHAEAGRVCPEPLKFAVELLETVVGGFGTDGATRHVGNHEDAESGRGPQWLRVTRGMLSSASIASGDQPPTTATKNHNNHNNGNDTADDLSSLLPSTAEDIQDLSFQQCFGGTDTEQGVYYSSVGWRVSAAAAAIKLLGRMADSWAEVDALPELLAPAQNVLKTIVQAAAALETSMPETSGDLDNHEEGTRRHQKSKKNGGADVVMKQKKGVAKRSTSLPATSNNNEITTTTTTTTTTILQSRQAVIAPALAALCCETLSTIDAKVSAARSRRLPLRSAALAAAPEVKQYNPRYEEQYVAGKDYDPDRERAERRKLQRELRREERGAVRELRRDAAFMAGVRDREKAALQSELDASARRAMSFLQQQETDFKSGGQGGMYKKRKKK